MNSQATTLVRRPNRFPITIKPGDVEARIYRTPTTTRGARYDAYTLCWHFKGKRQRLRFSDLTKARAEGERIVREKSNGSIAVSALTAADRIALESALAELAKIEGASSACVSRLVELVRDYASARAALPAGAGLLLAGLDLAGLFQAGEVDAAAKRVVVTVEQADRLGAARAVRTQNKEIAFGQFGDEAAAGVGATVAGERATGEPADWFCERSHRL